MRRRSIAAAVVAAVVVACAATGALAWIVGAGGGAGTAVGGALTAPAANAVTSTDGKPRISWTAVEVRPDDAAADGEIVYRIRRSADGGASWSDAGGTCAGPLAHTTLVCDDDPSPGTYRYEVRAAYRSWTSAGMTGEARTHNVTSLTAAAPAAGTTGITIGALDLHAALSGATAAPAAGGTITFSYYGPQATPPATCGTSGGGWTAFGTASVLGDGTYSPASGSFTPSTPGTYWWYASYGGDTLNFGSGSACAAATVVTNATAIAIGAPGAGTVGIPIPAAGLEADLTGGTSAPQAGGTMTISVLGPQASPPLVCEQSGAGWTVVGAASVAGDGAYGPGSSFTPAASGTYWWYASYGGDTLNGPSTSTCGAGMTSTAVAKAQPALTVSSGGAPATGTAGLAIVAASISATLTGRWNEDGSGSVAFYYVEQPAAPTDCAAGTQIGNGVTESGTSSYHPDAELVPSTAGTYWIYALYSGDTENLAAGACSFAAGQKIEVGRAQPSLDAAAPATGTAGTPVDANALTATLGGRVSEDGTGSISFFYAEQATAPTACSGGTAIGASVAESGAPTYHPSSSFTPATAGTYWIYAVYSGDTNNLDAASGCPPGSGQELVVARAQPSLSLAVVGAPAAGTAGEPFGADGITATLSGRVSEDGTGTVGFFVVAQATAPTDCTAGTAIGGPVSETGTDDYHPSVDFTPASAGTYWLYAVYSGDASNLPASGSCPPAAAQELDVAAAQPTLALSLAGPAAVTVGTAVPAASITVAIAGRNGEDGSGTVAFYYVAQDTQPTGCTGGTQIGAAVPESAALTYNPAVAFTPATPGTYWLYAVYSGDPANAAAAGTCPPTAAQALTVTAPAPPP